MTKSPSNDSKAAHSGTGSLPAEGQPPDQPMSDGAARHALDHGDNEKIDRALDELDVSTTRSGKDQTHKPDTEGSNSSSKNVDEQNE
ncbi:MAG: hypothetical protein QOI13_2497 [Paraburkholderia sp.]|nr:hypothetical protein [Paraburkholderia sp.]